MEWHERFVGNKYVQIHENGVVTHGSVEPLMTILELLNVELRDMFIMGLSADCGSVLVPTQRRAAEIREALTPAFDVSLKVLSTGDWEAKYDRRELDGTVPNWFVTDITLKNGTVVMRDGRWVR